MPPSPRPKLDPRGRAQTLGLLAVALRPPRDAKAFGEALAELRYSLDDEQIRGWIEVAERLARGTRMDREYHRLFLGPTRPIAPPFESVYRDGRNFGTSTAEFLQELRESGLEPVEKFRLPPDHVAIELEYLAQLIGRAAEARAGGRPEESEEWSARAQTFVDQHLAHWLPPFLGRLETAAPKSPYTAIVRAALEVVGVYRLGATTERA